MRKVSWIMLTILTLLFMLGSLASLYLAYVGSPSDDVLTATTSLADLNLDPALTTALRARRGTAAALGLGFGTLLLCIILGPYRAGDRGAWLTIFAGMLVFTAAAVLRVPLLGSWPGADTALILMVLVLIALLLDLKRLSEPRL